MSVWTKTLLLEAWFFIVAPALAVLFLVKWLRGRRAWRRHRALSGL